MTPLHMYMMCIIICLLAGLLSIWCDAINDYGVVHPRELGVFLFITFIPLGNLFSALFLLYYLPGCIKDALYNLKRTGRL